MPTTGAPTWLPLDSQYACILVGHLDDSGDDYKLCIHYLSGTHVYDLLEDSRDEYSFLLLSASILLNFLDEYVSILVKLINLQKKNILVEGSSFFLLANNNLDGSVCYFLGAYFHVHTQMARLGYFIVLNLLIEHTTTPV